MRSIHKIRTRDQRRHQRHLRVRHKVSGSPERPRLVVFRSSKHIYAQLVDDTRGVTLVGAADRSEGGAGGTGRAGEGAGAGEAAGAAGVVGVGGVAGVAGAAGAAGGAAAAAAGAASAAMGVSVSAKATACSKT